MKTLFFIIIRALQSLSISSILRVFFFMCRHPFFSVLSVFATYKTYTIAAKIYPKTASKDGIGNAFRHALWCCLIMMYCCKISSPTKAKLYCKQLTDMHEELFPNPVLQKMMDLHNNALGIALFMQMSQNIHRQFFETQFFIEVLQKKIINAQVIVPNTQADPENLVYLV